MIFYVLAMHHYLEVFNRVIERIEINVMHYLTFSEFSTKMFFDYNSMSIIRFIGPNISNKIPVSRLKIFSTLPHRMSLTKIIVGPELVITRPRTKYSFLF